MSGKWAKSRTRGRKLHSTEAKARGGWARKTRADLEQRLKACRRQIAQARERLVEVMKQQTATSEMLRIISNSPIQSVLDAVAENVARLCEANNADAHQAADPALRSADLRRLQTLARMNRTEESVMPRCDLTMVSWPPYPGRKASLLALVVLAGALTGAAPTVRSSSGAEPITPILVPAGLDPRRVTLGDQLFHDPRLSHDNTLSCGSCHDTSTNGAGANARDRDANGSLLPFNTLTVFNAALNFRLNWEGNVRTLEREAEGGLRDPAFMGPSAAEAVAKISADPAMAQRFRDAYGRAPDAAALLDAIATYERSLLTPGGRFDRWLAGETSAISAEELSGYQLFKSLGCISCHQGVNVGGNLFQRHGVFRALGTPEPEFVRVPSLRNVAATAPYFHDGSAETLNEAVRQMGLAQLDRVLTDSQVGSIVAFLGTLTGTYRGRSVMPARAGPSADTVPR